MQASLQKFYFFYSHSRFRLTWQGTRKPLGGLVVISVIASSTVKAVAVLRAAEQASPRHSSPLGVVRLPSSRWSLLPLLAFAPLCAKKPHSLLINAQEPLCGWGAWWRVLAAGRGPRRWGWVGSHRPGLPCPDSPGWQREAGKSLNTRLCSALSPFLLFLLCTLQRRGGWCWTFYLRG